jgi:GntR family transcriptional regulator
MANLNPMSKIPLYQQLYDILHTKILNEEWKPGDMILPESKLIELYSVSRITVRTVLDMLVKDSLIYRQRGRGTFVTHPKLEHGLTRIVNFTDDMHHRGFTPSSKVLYSDLIPATKAIATKLSIDPGEELTRLGRLRLADNEPMCLEKSHFIHRYCRGILDYDFAVTSLCEVKERDYGIKWSRATQIISAINATPNLAKHLIIKKNAALLYIERTSYSQDNTPVEFLQAYYRADRYNLYNELQGGAG